MSAPDYMPEPETPKEKAAARRYRLRTSGPGAVFDAIKHRKGPNDAFYDTAAVLAFEAANPARPDKEELIRRTFNCTATRYFQRLFHLTHDEEALKESLRIDAATVNRLLRLEDERSAARRRRAEGMTDL